MRSEHLGGLVVLHGGDSRDVLKGLADASIDSVVTDPPYALVSITKRFGADGAAGVKVPEGGSGAYARASSGFMGKKWDTGEAAFAVTFWAEIMRVLKPGGHVVAFSGTRTYHRLACAIEDAGFEIRDQLAWAYGTGFPKSHAVDVGLWKGVLACQSKDNAPLVVQISAFTHLKSNEAKEYIVAAPALILPEGSPALIIQIGAAGGSSAMTVMSLSESEQTTISSNTGWLWDRSLAESSDPRSMSITETKSKRITTTKIWKLLTSSTTQKSMHGGATLKNGWTWPAVAVASGSNAADTSSKDIPILTVLDDATWNPVAQAKGAGSALKPSWEPIVLARKPLSGTVAANVLEHGTGALNVDGCRVGTEERTYEPKGTSTNAAMIRVPEHRDGNAGDAVTVAGRWPANIIHDGSDEVVGCFPETKSGLLQTHHKMAESENGSMSGKNYARSPNQDSFGDSGSAARFFFQAQESDIEWLVRNLNLSHADIAEFLSFPPNGAVCSALNDAVTSGLPAEAQCEVLYPERIMSVTATELRVIAEAVIAATQTIGERFLRGLPLESATELPNHAQFALRRMPTGIITITISRWTSDGCADPVTFNITPLNSEAGAPASARSTARLFYSGKADKQDRIGSKHPTVKPVDLMQWLCRLVTPPGGTVLDPFAGSGSTGEAAWREGFQCVLIEREPEYQADIAERLRLADKGPIERKARSIKQASGAGPLFGDNDNERGGEGRSTATSPIRTNDWADRTEAMTPEQEAAARALAASIPPTKSTPEEIAARRAARKAAKDIKNAA